MTVVTPDITFTTGINGRLSLGTGDESRIQLREVEYPKCVAGTRNVTNSLSAQCVGSSHLCSSSSWHVARSAGSSANILSRKSVKRGLSGRPVPSIISSRRKRSLKRIFGEPVAMTVKATHAEMKYCMLTIFIEEILRVLPALDQLQRVVPEHHHVKVGYR